MSETLNDEEFNRVFWPGLDYNLKINSKLHEKNMESRQIAQELGQAKKDIICLNRELKNKLFDLQSFVKISNSNRSFFRPRFLTQSRSGALYPHHASMPDRLIYCADMALLKAKSMGRNLAVMFKMEFAGDANSTKGSFNENRQESIP